MKYITPVQISLFEEQRGYRVYHLTTHPYIPVYYHVNNFEQAKKKIMDLILKNRKTVGCQEVDISRIGLEIKDCGMWNEWKDIGGKTICETIGLKT